MKAVIMAGGRGSRLRPLTCNLPKPMVPILNIPVMEHIIHLLKSQGITEMAVTTYYLPQVIKDYFGSGDKWNVTIEYFNEETPLGTAGSVHNAVDFLDETFLVISGDAITDFDLQQGINFHEENNSEATLVLSKEDIPLDYGVVMTNQQGEIIRFLEKPDWGQVFSDTVNTGIYILEPAIFSLYEKGIKFDFSQDLFPLMMEKNRGLYGIVLEGYWNDIGNVEEFLETGFDILKGNVDLPLPECKEIAENVYAEKNVDIHENVNLEGPIYIGEETIIGDNVYLEKCILGKNNNIQANSSLKHSVLGDNCYIGKKSQLRGTVLSDKVKLKKEVNVYDHTVIGKKTAVGNNVTIKPGIKIWPEKEIESGIEVDSSIIWSPRWSRELFSDLGVKGLSNIDINPEFAAKLAAAFAATIDKGSEIAVSCDSYQISRSLKKAIISGLQSSGIDVIDIGQTVTPVLRYSVYNLEAKGGVNIRVSPRDPEKITIEFLNEQGANIDYKRQKAIEKKYFAEDYSRADLKQIGGFSRAPGMNKSYLDEITNNLAADKIRRNYFNLVLDYEYDNLLELLPVFLKKLNCQIISTRNFSYNGLPLPLKDRLQAREKMGRIIRDNGYDLGVIVDHNAEQLNLVNNQGKIMAGSEFQVLLSYILLEKGIEKLYLPVNAPRVIESLAGNYDTEIKYTPIRPQFIMNKFMADNGDKYIFYPFRDVIYSLGLILEKMALDNITYNQLLNVLPEFHLDRTQVKCSREDKGRVMRHLSEEQEQKPQNTELIDGIKYNHDKGWVLVLPDSEAATFHVYAEADDAETASSLAGFYRQRLQELIEK